MLRLLIYPPIQIYNLLVKLPFFRYSQYHNINSGVQLV